MGSSHSSKGELEENSNEASKTYRKLAKENLVWQNVIGTGSTSIVRLAYEQPQGIKMAIKITSNADFTKLKTAINEKLILAKLKHPLIIGFYGTFHDSQNCYLALEYIPDELYAFLLKHGPFSESKAKKILREIALALVYLHSQGIIHRDLKPENILILPTGHIKLADFGYSKELKHDERASTVCGTPYYMAPEVVSGCYYDYKCDWWALGIILFEMLTGSTPFDGDSIQEIYTNILTLDFYFQNENDATSQLLQGLLERNPNKRLAGANVLDHDFFDQ